MSNKVIELQNIKRNFIVGDETVHALRGVSFSIDEGEFVTIMGTSGSGKSTLLNILGCLDTPTSGEYLLDSIPVRTMSKPQRAVLRNRARRVMRAALAEHLPADIGGYDIILHSYGPERTLGTCNVEVPIDTHAEDIFDAMTDATHDIMKSMGIYLTFGMYAVNDYRSDVRQMKERALAVMKEASDSVLSLHAFHVHFDTRMVHFDVVVDFRVHNYAELKKQLEARLKEEWPDFDFEFWIDPDYA